MFHVGGWKGVQKFIRGSRVSHTEVVNHYHLWFSSLLKLQPNCSYLLVSSCLPYPEVGEGEWCTTTGKLNELCFWHYLLVLWSWRNIVIIWFGDLVKAINIFFINYQKDKKPSVCLTNKPRTVETQKSLNFDVVGFLLRRRVSYVLMDSIWWR